VKMKCPLHKDLTDDKVGTVCVNCAAIIRSALNTPFIHSPRSNLLDVAMAATALARDSNTEAVAETFAKVAAALREKPS